MVFFRVNDKNAIFVKNFIFLQLLSKKKDFFLKRPSHFLSLLSKENLYQRLKKSTDRNIKKPLF
jgi:hypothetical protein